MSSLALTTAATPAIVGQTAELTVCISQEDHQKAENCELKVDQHHPIQVLPDDSAGGNTSSPTPETKRKGNMIKHICKEVFNHIMPTNDNEKQQERFSKYSLKALGFVICLLFASLASASPSTMNTDFKISIAACCSAISTDMVSILMKTKWARALVYLSSFNLSLMTFIMFLSFDKVSGYAIPALLLIIIGIARLNHIKEEASDQYLDSIFDLSALFLNSGGLFTCVIAYIVPIHVESTNHTVAASAVAFFFMSTIIFSIYLMVITTVNIKALTRHLNCFGFLLYFLVMGTLVTIFITATEIKLSATSSASN